MRRWDIFPHIFRIRFWWRFPLPDRYQMWHPTDHSQHTTKTNHRRTQSTFWRISVASSHTHRRLSVRRCARLTAFHCNGRALHRTGTHERHNRLFGRTRYSRFGRHRGTDAGWKAFCEPQIHSSEIQISYRTTRSIRFGVAATGHADNIHVGCVTGGWRCEVISIFF